MGRINLNQITRTGSVAIQVRQETQVRPRTIIALILALVAGLCASIATYGLVDHHGRPPGDRRDGSDIGLTP
jgi:hypothetical protein